MEEPPRDQITGMKRRPKLELPQYVGDQENQGPATVRENVTPLPTEGTRKGKWKVCQKDKGESQQYQVAPGAPLFPSVCVRKAQAAGAVCCHL